MEHTVNSKHGATNVSFILKFKRILWHKRISCPFQWLEMRSLCISWNEDFSLPKTLEMFRGLIVASFSYFPAYFITTFSLFYYYFFIYLFIFLDFLFLFLVLFYLYFLLILFLFLELFVLIFGLSLFLFWDPFICILMLFYSHISDICIEKFSHNNETFYLFSNQHIFSNLLIFNIFKSNYYNKSREEVNNREIR